MIFNLNLNFRKIIKELLKTLNLINFYRSTKKLFNRNRHYLQKIQSTKNPQLTYLGSEYGGWSLLDNDNLKNGTIISAGLGEDASFDIEFASKYNAKVIIIDPTPRAIKHYNHIINNLGGSKKISYVDGGNQPIESYDLSKIKSNNLYLIEKALWNKNCTLKFYQPVKSKNVSYSVFNNKNTKSINVKAINIVSILRNLQIPFEDVKLIKLDIECAEIEVIENMIQVNFLPEQILVEFDDLSSISKEGFDRVTKIDKILTGKGYKMIHTDGEANFLYYRNQA